MTRNNLAQIIPKDDSPLKQFSTAKNRITNIYDKIKEQCHETELFFEESQINSKFGLLNYQQKFSDYRIRIQAIQKILSRDKMKVVFFGRTSNGKSSVVNCMLHSELVPANIGHTTSCFIQVEGCGSNSPRILFEDIEENYSLKRVEQLSTDISSKKLSPDSLMKLLLPKEHVTLLKDDVVLVDTPGVDVTPDLDSWIDLHCMDADVFVLVENAVSTLSQAEKNFFLKVSARLSKPNIFVLYNHWDAASGFSEEDYSRVKEQHLQRSLTFLVDELKVTDRKTAQKRIFFVSAKETLENRVNRSFIELSGRSERLAEFEQFELVFQDCISNSAIHTKFEHHALFAKNVLNESSEIISNAAMKANDMKDETASKMEETNEKLNSLRTDLVKFINLNKTRISKLMESAEIIISKAFKTEIKRLGFLLNDYEAHFSTNPDIIEQYKNGLNEFVEEAVRLSMSARCSALDREIRDSMDCIIESMLGLIPEQMGDKFRRLVPLSKFSLSYHVDLKSLCSGFKEDIEFHFSLHPSRLLGLNSMGLVSQGSKMSLFRNLGVSAALISSAALKDIGWKALTLMGTAYCLLYLFEKFTWTTKARERALQHQYVSYASSKLNSIVGLTSSSCGQQIKQELNGLTERLNHVVVDYEGELTSELSEYTKDLSILESSVVEMQKCRNRSSLVDKELDDFLNTFLSKTT